MAELGQTQRVKLKTLAREFKKLQKLLQAMHKKTAYEDLEHGVSRSKSQSML